MKPGVSVGNSNSRFGNQDFTIRGIGGNRVLIQVDNIRLPDNYVGRGRNYFELDTLKRVEIIRGPASSLYGSDAIGGVVSFITKDPEDYLFLSDDSFFGSAKVNFDSSDESTTFTGVIAAEDEEGIVQTSVVFTRGVGSEFKNYGSITANPQDAEDLNLLGKVVYNFNENSSLKFTGELYNSNTETNVLSSIGTTPFDVSGFPLTFFDREGVQAEDSKERYRISLDYQYDNPDNGWLQKLNGKIYLQNSEIVEDVISTGEQFFVPFPRARFDIRREEQNSFKQGIVGGELQLESNFSTGDIDHRLVYGLEVFNTRTERLRDNTIFNLTTRSESKFVIGEEFPNKTFPDTDTLQLGVYVQDEIEIADGRLTIIPGIRFNYYSFNADEDDDFARINVNNYTVEDFSESAFTPRLGLNYKVTPELSAYAQYARGFRSPPYDDANVAFTNFAFGYTVLPNGNLEPETSDSFELGLRGNYDSFDFGLTGFYNNYDNFIDTVGLGPRSGDRFLQFQSQNIEGAEIYGAEARAEYRFNGAAADGLSLIASLAWAEGNNLQTDQPLNSVDPLEAVVGLRYRAPEDRWGAELATTFTGQKSPVDDPPNGELFVPESYLTLDLLGYYNITDNVSLNIGLFNLLDEKRWRWQDVNGLTATSSEDINRRALPGFNASVGLKITF